MSSANDHLLSPPKQKMSPLEFRNTDLVSRLLAATPPYLYNMSLLPNTYFFSEMLRSLVQAKNEQHRASGLHPPLRRSRKRAWSQQRHDFPIMESPKQEPSEPWMIKSNKKPNEERENPLELTTKFENTNEEPSQSVAKLENDHSNNIASFQNAHQHLMAQQDASNLVLPPPPPMWYPPIYPTPPYGIDPLHFFIDLRVSGHIYDRKNQRDTPNSTVVSPREELITGTTEEKDVKREEDVATNKCHSNDFLKQRRHCSAFSVPNKNNNKDNMTPMNLMSTETKTKFDVKSLGFDKTANKTSTNYFMKNVTDIYKNLERQKLMFEEDQTVENNLEETEEERQKRVKDLRALIGLELVVDYMKHKKPAGVHGIQNVTHESADSNSNSNSDIELVGSPALDVVDLQDN